MKREKEMKRKKRKKDIKERQKKKRKIQLTKRKRRQTDEKKRKNDRQTNKGHTVERDHRGIIFAFFNTIIKNKMGDIFLLALKNLFEMYS